MEVKQEQFVELETPNGTVDGANTSFEVSSAILDVVELLVDGVVYTKFTFSGSTVVLDDAPTTSIQISYFKNI